MALTIAYLTGGRIRLKTGDEDPRTLESPYAKSVHDKSVRSQQRHAWKTEGDGGLFAGPMVWGKATPGAGPEPVLATSVARGARAGQLVYSLASGSLQALCESEALGAEERRLWNDHQRRVSQVHARAETGDLVLSVQLPNGTANIGILLKNDPGINEVTEGDSIDASPAWVPGSARRVVYQSAGIGRNPHGHFVALGPFGLHAVDIDTAEMETLQEEPESDFLSPRLLEDGTLYYIRRPYSGQAQINHLRVLKDTLLVPFRVLYALFQFMNFFSARYTGRKLSTPANTPKRDLNLRQMMIWGNLVQAQEAAAGEDAPDLVPSSWQLIRLRPDAAEETLAKGVLAYDLAADGTIAYSNGSAVFLRTPDGRVQRLLTERMIEQVVLV